ncbi:MAG: glutamate synthase central domain-containing protein, partial [Pseudomonadota bacterium]
MADDINRAADASAWRDHYEAERARLEAAGAYRRSDEHDACGVGLVAAIDGAPRREVVEIGVKALKSVWHRGAVDADGKTGDGAGIHIDVSQDFFREQIERTGHEPRGGHIGVGMIFLPRTDYGAQERCRTIVESEILRRGYYIYGWRQVPVNTDVIGDKAKATRPEIEQIMFTSGRDESPAALERDLFLVRRSIEKRARAASLNDFYVCSLSGLSVVYKGMFLAQNIDDYFPDLRDERFISKVAIYHQRYSTNTFPTWWLAQPFRMLAHNGEINTLKGNVNWMRSHEIRMVSEAFGQAGEAIRPVIAPGSSDSAALDAVFEVLVRAGRSAPMTKSLMIPEAWSKRSSTMPEAHQALYSYGNSIMEPWDGPAAVCATDGRWAIAGMDRNGLRPLRYSYTEDGLLVVGSEAGMAPLEESRIVQKGRVPPGQMIAVDLEENKLYQPREIIDFIARSQPFEKWCERITPLDGEIREGPEPVVSEGEMLRRRQYAAGFSMEDLELIVPPMAETAKEAIGSMGDDTPLAVLSKKYRPLPHFFRQNFSQVTNPPIDPIREERVMSLKTRFGNLGNVLAEDSLQSEVFVLDSPVLSNGMYERLLARLGGDVAVIDCPLPAEAHGLRQGATALRSALDRIRDEA